MAGKTVVIISTVFNLDMHLSYIVTSAGDSLNKEFLEPDIMPDNGSDSFEGSINRPVTRFSSGKFLSMNIEGNSGHGDSGLAGNDLQVVEFDSFSAKGFFIANQQLKVLIFYFLFPIRYFKEFLVHRFKSRTLETISQILKPVFKCSAAAASSKGND